MEILFWFHGLVLGANSFKAAARRSRSELVQIHNLRISSACSVFQIGYGSKTNSGRIRILSNPLQEVLCDYSMECCFLAVHMSLQLTLSGFQQGSTSLLRAHHLISRSPRALVKTLPVYLDQSLLAMTSIMCCGAGMSQQSCSTQRLARHYPRKIPIYQIIMLYGTRSALLAPRTSSAGVANCSESCSIHLVLSWKWHGKGREESSSSMVCHWIAILA